jgi:hypothetical protein
MRSPVLLAVMLACTASSEVQPWERIDIGEWNVALVVPPGWRVDPPTAPGVQGISSGDVSDGANCNLVVRDISSWAGLSAAEVRRSLTMSAEEVAATPGVKKLESRWGPAGGREGLYLVFDHDQVRPEGTALVRHIQVQVPRETVMIQLTCSSHRTTFDRRRGLFESVIAGLEVR